MKTNSTSIATTLFIRAIAMETTFPVTTGKDGLFVPMFCCVVQRCYVTSADCIDICILINQHLGYFRVTFVRCVVQGFSLAAVVPCLNADGL